MWRHYRAVCLQYISLPVFLPLYVLHYMLPIQRDKSCCCWDLHHVYLFHWSHMPLILQTELHDGRTPIIKKCLFPLFISKNNITHSSSVRVLPIVSSPMVQLPFYCTLLIYSLHDNKLPLHAINNINHLRFMFSSSKLVFKGFFDHNITMNIVIMSWWRGNSTNQIHLFISLFLFETSHTVKIYRTLWWIRSI